MKYDPSKVLDALLITIEALGLEPFKPKISTVVHGEPTHGLLPGIAVFDITCTVYVFLDSETTELCAIDITRKPDVANTAWSPAAEATG